MYPSLWMKGMAPSTQVCLAHRPRQQQSMNSDDVSQPLPLSGAASEILSTFRVHHARHLHNVKRCVSIHSTHNEVGSLSFLESRAPLDVAAM